MKKAAHRGTAWVGQRAGQLATLCSQSPGALVADLRHPTMGRLAHCEGSVPR